MGSQAKKMKLSTIICCLMFTFATGVAPTTTRQIVCKEGLDKKFVHVRPGVTYSYRTQAGKLYAPKTRCSVLFKRGSSCSKLRFSCSKFQVLNRSDKCAKLDKMVVKVGKKTTNSYCQKSGPDISTSENIRVIFLTGLRKVQRRGAVCKAECTSPSTTSTTSTTTTSIVRLRDLSGWGYSPCGDKRDAVGFVTDRDVTLRGISLHSPKDWTPDLTATIQLLDGAGNLVYSQDLDSYITDTTPRLMGWLFTSQPRIKADEEYILTLVYDFCVPLWSSENSMIYPNNPTYSNGTCDGKQVRFLFSDPPQNTWSETTL